MRAIICKPGEEAVLCETAGDYKSIKKTIGGYIQAVHLGGRVHAYIHEEGLLEGLKWNRIVLGHFIAGPLLVLADGPAGEEAGLSDVEAIAVQLLLNQHSIRLDSSRSSSIEELRDESRRMLCWLSNSCTAIASTSLSPASSPAGPSASTSKGPAMKCPSTIRFHFNPSSKPSSWM